MTELPPHSPGLVSPLRTRPLGRTGLVISPVAFGAGPVSGLMTGPPSAELRARQRATVRRAVELGINWFDTAPGYGLGVSEQALGEVLAELGLSGKVQMATKIRVDSVDLNDLAGSVERSVETSLKRLRCQQIALLQLHNSITRHRGDLPTSLAVCDVLGPGGIAQAFERVKAQGQVLHTGLTGLGNSAAVTEVVASGEFATIQLPLNALQIADPLAEDSAVGELPCEPLVSTCRRLGMGILAIRVFAGGALALAPPAPYTHVTKFFTLDVYQRDVEATRRARQRLPEALSLPEFAVRSVLGYPGVAAAIIGFSSLAEVEQAVQAATAEGLPPEQVRKLVSG